MQVHTHFGDVVRTRESIDLSCWDMQQTETSDSRIQESHEKFEIWLFRKWEQRNADSPAAAENLKANSRAGPLVTATSATIFATCSYR